MENKKAFTITILGTGYVGLTTAALFAAAGIKTYIVDTNPERLEPVRNGKSFFYEAGLDALIRLGLKNGKLIPTMSYENSVPFSNIVFSAVGTPDNPDGSSNLDYVFAAAKEAAKYTKPATIYVQKSTVPVGTGRTVEKFFKSVDGPIFYVSNPEFLREGTAIADSLWFDRIVTGGDENWALQQIQDLYRRVEDVRQDIAAVAAIEKPIGNFEETYIRTTLESAELIKVVSNAFLALKISFANSIAKLADRTNADIVEVMEGVGSDSRIGRAFLDAGRGYGGGCFPKDVSGLIAVGEEHGVGQEIMKSAQSVNKSMPTYIVNKIENMVGGPLANHKMAVLGLSFKSGTSDTRKSPGIALANILCSKGVNVVAFDPQAAVEEIDLSLDPRARLVNSFDDAIADSDVVIVATDWSEFTNVAPAKYARMMAGNVFVDAMNKFNQNDVVAAGLHYVGVGRDSSFYNKTQPTDNDPSTAKDLHKQALALDF